MLNPQAATFDLIQHESSRPSPRSKTGRQTLEHYRRSLTHTKRLISNIVHDYRILGHRYHSFPPYVRYHEIARADGIHLDAARNFVVSGDYELPELITMLGTFEFVIEQIEPLLAEPAESLDLRTLQSKFAMLETQVPYALILIAKLQTIMRIYVEVVCQRSNIRRALQSGW